MSWEHKKYQAFCENCGRTGFCIKASDDWGRSATSWIGFDNKPPNPHEVARKKISGDDYEAVCNCDKSKVVLGKCLGECAANGVITKPAPESTTLWVIVQLNRKHLNYELKRHGISKHVQRNKGTRMSPGVYAMSRSEASTPRRQMIREFVEAGMLDESDRVTCIEACNWNLYPEDFPKRNSKVEFMAEPEEV
jgi:hypothetical protein